MNSAGEIVIWFWGDGRTDIGPLDTDPVDLKKGVLVILVDFLCGNPSRMRVRRQPYPHLQDLKKVAGQLSIARKVEFAKMRAHQNKASGAVYVVDSEGDLALLDQLCAGRDASLPDFPMAVGVAHPCLEAWLLCDHAAIRKAIASNNLSATPIQNPESLPAPAADRQNNPKVELQRVAGIVSREQKEAIALAIRVMDRLRHGCPQSFSPFADEIEQRIKPLFIVS